MSLGQYTLRVDQRFLQAVAPQPPACHRVLLYDFETGRYDLLPRHREALTQYVLPYLEPNAPPVSVWIGGLASRRGEEGFNRGLSFARAMTVEQFILQRAPHVATFGGRHTLTTHYYGERYSTNLTENSEFHRSVLVVMCPFPRPQRPAQPEPAPTRAHSYNRFRILLAGGFDGGEVIAVGSYRFVIDYEPEPGAPPSDPVMYKLRCGGLGAGAPFSVSAGNPQTHWNSFTSPRVTTTRGFEGYARLGARGWSLGPVGRRLLGPLSEGSHTFLRLLPSASAPHDILIEPLQTDSISFGAVLLSGPFEIDWEGTRQWDPGRPRYSR